MRRFVPCTWEGKKVVLWDSPDYKPEGNTLEFRLTYEGELHGASNRDPRATHKHDIRKIFHYQLKRLWEITPYLNEAIYPMPNAMIIVGEHDFVKRIDHLSENFRLGDYRFVPLVTTDLWLWCGIDILFLRTGPPGRIFSSGDIDNRVSTLMDALKRPTQMEELGNHKDRKPSANENPMFCLLENDGLVAKFSAETDVLLEPIAGGIPSNSDARIVITVKLRPAIPSLRNAGFGD